MKHLAKRTISLLLAALMVLAMVPAMPLVADAAEYGANWQYASGYDIINGAFKTAEEDYIYEGNEPYDWSVTLAPAGVQANVTVNAYIENEAGQKIEVSGNVAVAKDVETTILSASNFKDLGTDAYGNFRLVVEVVYNTKVIAHMEAVFGRVPATDSTAPVETTAPEETTAPTETQQPSKVEYMAEWTYKSGYEFINGAFNTAEEDFIFEGTPYDWSVTVNSAYSAGVRIDANLETQYGEVLTRSKEATIPADQEFELFNCTAFPELTNDLIGNFKLTTTISAMINGVVTPVAQLVAIFGRSKSVPSSAAPIFSESEWASCEYPPAITATNDGDVAAAISTKVTLTKPDGSTLSLNINKTVEPGATVDLVTGPQLMSAFNSTPGVYSITVEGYWGANDNTFSETFTYEYMEHNLETIAGYAATCTMPGLTDGVYCPNCNWWVTEQTEIPIDPSAHTFVNGTCSACGQFDESYNSILTFTLNETGDGYIVSGCDASFSGDLVIPGTYNGLPVTSIGVGAFRNRKSLTSATLLHGITRIDDSAFAGCDNLYSVTIPDSVTYIGGSAFYYCTNLRSVVIPDSVTLLDMRAFSNCHNLASVTLSKNITGIYNLTFESCAFTTITIPESVTVIGSSAFYNCGNLTRIFFEGSAPTLEDGELFGFEATAYYYPDETWTEEAMQNFGDAIKWVSLKNVSVYGIFGNDLIWTLDTEGTLTISGTGAMDDYFYSFEAPWYDQCDVVYSVVIDEGITIIGDSTFEHCNRLERVVVSTSVTSIGDNAFGDCNNLGNVIYCGTQEQWDAISIGDNNNPLLNAALQFHKYEDGMCTYCGTVDCEFMGHNMQETAAEVPAGCETTGKTAVYTCTNGCGKTEGGEEIPAKGHSYENSICTICQHYNGPLTFTLNETGDGYIVSDCAEPAYGSLEVVIPATYNGLPVTSIGNDAFSDTRSLNSVIIPDSVTNIGDYAFSCCYNLKSITIPDSVTNIGDGAFYACYSLKSIIIPDGITTIGSSAFASCFGLTSVTIPDSVTSIGDVAFVHCTGLTSVTIPDSVNSIGWSAFYGCTSLASVIYCGTQEQWDAIEMGDSNEPLINATLQLHNYENCVCAVCGAIEHSWVDANCTVPKTCANCGAIESEALGHEAGASATCEAAQTCIRCDYVFVEALGHTPAEAVKENEIPATPEAEGSYDEVVYCSVCGEELNRNTVVTEKLTVNVVIPDDGVSGDDGQDLTEEQQEIVQQILEQSKQVQEALNLPDNTYLKITMSSAKVDGEKVTRIVYKVKPITDGKENSNPNQKITFYLPVPYQTAKTVASVFHNGILLGTDYEIKTNGEEKWVEVTSDNFSEFSVDLEYSNLDENGKQSATVTVSTDADTYYRGDTVIVTVHTSPIEHCSTGGFMFEYDTDIFEYVSGEALVTGYSGAGISTANGRVAGYFMGGDEILQGDIFRITLKVKDNADFASYTISGTPSFNTKIGEVKDTVTCTTEEAAVTIICNHSFGEWIKLNEAEHKHICTICSYEETELIDYTVVFQYADGTVISSAVYHYGDAVEVPMDPPAQFANNAFMGWDQEIVSCAGDTVYTAVFVEYIPGDIDTNGTLNDDDAVYLLLYTMFGEEFYPLSYVPADIDCNEIVDHNDAIYLLLHTLFGEEFYPLNAQPAIKKEEELI